MVYSSPDWWPMGIAAVTVKSVRASACSRSILSVANVMQGPAFANQGLSRRKVYIAEEETTIETRERKERNRL